MTPERFCYWLQGFSELTTLPPAAAQWQSIREHLAVAIQSSAVPDPNILSPRTRPIVPSGRSWGPFDRAPENFCSWLDGCTEQLDKAPTQEQWDVIVSRLAAVFHKVTPEAPGTRASCQPCDCDLFPRLIC